MNAVGVRDGDSTPRQSLYREAVDTDHPAGEQSKACRAVK